MTFSEIKIAGKRLLQDRGLDIAVGCVVALATISNALSIRNQLKINKELNRVKKAADTLEDAAVSIKKVTTSGKTLVFTGFEAHNSLGLSNNQHKIK